MGVFKDLEEICQNIAVERTFTPALAEEKRQRHLAGWHRAVERALRWAE